jgi:hypothetical protein
MKRPFPKSLNKVLILALAVFGFFFVRSLTIVLRGYRFDYQEPKAGPAPAVSQKEILPRQVDSAVFDKLKARNFFVSVRAAAKNAPAPVPAEPALPPLQPNEVREETTKTVYKYLGTIILGDVPLAFFAKEGPAEKGEASLFFLPKGRSLGKTLRVDDIGEKWVKVNQAGKKTDLNIFFLEIKQIGNEKKAIQK